MLNRGFCRTQTESSKLNLAKQIQMPFDTQHDNIMPSSLPCDGQALLFSGWGRGANYLRGHLNLASNAHAAFVNFR